MTLWNKLTQQERHELTGSLGHSGDRPAGKFQLLRTGIENIPYYHAGYSYYCQTHMTIHRTDIWATNISRMVSIEKPKPY